MSTPNQYLVDELKGFPVKSLDIIELIGARQKGNPLGWL